MTQWKNTLAADARKLTATPFFILHLALPVLGGGVVLLYGAVAKYDAAKLAMLYVQLLALVYPLVAAWACNIIAQQELEAGGGYQLLTGPRRGVALGSKLFYLLACGLLACLLAVGGYGLVVNAGGAALPGFGRLAVTLWASMLFTYLLHLWLGLGVGRSVGFAVAAGEVLVAALLMTGLGDSIWYVVPCAWGVRFVSMRSMLLWQPGLSQAPALQAELWRGAMAALVITLAMAVFVLFWFARWEGRREEE